MKALLQMIRRVAEEPFRPWALATLVRTQGSTYRKPGARLLVCSEGGIVGVLSGGCLEDEIAQHGRRVIDTGAPQLLSFDTRRLYGCDGKLQIFVERIPPAGAEGNLLTQLGEKLERREACRVRTCFEQGSLGSDLLPPDALLAERAGVFIHAVPLPIRLLLFGTGPEIEPLTSLGANLGWIVQRHAHPTELADDFRPDSQTAAVVMTHHFGRDLAALDRLLPLRLPYVGLLGPRKRHTELIARLQEYRPIDPEWFDPLHAPAGLDIGSEAPEEIALSIVSEVAAVLAGRRGGCLRERNDAAQPAPAARDGKAA
jgi:xanthine/CO dehydrogenase XdhC/CoxF family maturation factor